MQPIPGPSWGGGDAPQMPPDPSEGEVRVVSGSGVVGPVSADSCREVCLVLRQSEFRACCVQLSAGQTSRLGWCLQHPVTLSQTGSFLRAAPGLCAHACAEQAAARCSS